MQRKVMKTRTEQPNRVVSVYNIPSFYEGCEQVRISPIRDNPPLQHIICNVYADGHDQVYKARYTSVCKQPSVTSLIRWSEDGICKSVGGRRIEPDGYDQDGFPIWLLVVGMI